MYVINEAEVAREYTISQLKADNPTVGFPPDPTDALLAEYDVYLATETDPPEYDEAYQRLVYSFVGSGSDWTQEWAAVDAGVTLFDLRESRYDDNERHSDSLADTANATPAQGVLYSARQVAKRQRVQGNTGRRNKLDKVSEADDYLFDWLGVLAKALDDADDLVENLDRAGLEAWVPTDATWPTWTPYTP